MNIKLFSVNICLEHDVTQIQVNFMYSSHWFSGDIKLLQGRCTITSKKT